MRNVWCTVEEVVDAVAGVLPDYSTARSTGNGLTGCAPLVNADAIHDMNMFFSHDFAQIAD